MASKIDGDTQIVAILGDPVTQVKSPELFNRLFEQMSQNAVLIPFQVASDELGVVLDGLRRIGNLVGVVVTVPHKVAATRYAARLTPAASAVGAVNCLRRESDGDWTGAMFDGVGFVDGLAARGHAVRGKHVLLVGAGGAGAAVAHALVDRKVARLDIFDTRQHSQQSLLAALRARKADSVVRACEACASGGHDLMINATPCGMRDTDPVPIDLSAAQKGAVVADLIMKPATTRLLAEAKARGLAVHEGRHLLEQSVESIADFLGLMTRRTTDRENPVVTSSQGN